MSDNLKIAAKVVTTFIVLLGLLYVVHSVTSPIVSAQYSGAYPGELSGAAKVAGAVYAIFLFLTFVVPLLVLRSGLRQRKRQR